MINEKFERYLNKLSTYREAADYDVLTLISKGKTVESIKNLKNLFKNNRLN